MPFDYYESTSVINGNAHTLTLSTPVTPDVNGHTHTLTMATPIVPGVSWHSHTVDLSVPLVYDPRSSDYNWLSNKPIINEVELIGELSLQDLGIQPAGNYWTKEELTPLTEADINEITGFI